MLEGVINRDGEKVRKRKRKRENAINRESENARDRKREIND